MSQEPQALVPTAGKRGRAALARSTWSVKRVVKTATLIALAIPTEAVLNFVGPGAVKGGIVMPLTADAVTASKFTTQEEKIFDALRDCGPFEPLLRGTQWPQADLLTMRALPLRGMELGLVGADGNLTSCITDAAKAVSFPQPTKTELNGSGPAGLLLFGVILGIGVVCEFWRFLDLQSEVAKRRLAAPTTAV